MLIENDINDKIKQYLLMQKMIETLISFANIGTFRT